MSVRVIWRQAFLKALADGGVVKYACEAAGISRKNAYRTRRLDATFAAQWEEALEEAADSLEAEVRKRAFAGSDLLLIFLMKGLRPEKFREKVFISTAQLDKLIERELKVLKGEEPEQSEQETVN